MLLEWRIYVRCNVFDEHLSVLKNVQRNKKEWRLYFKHNVLLTWWEKNWLLENVYFELILLFFTSFWVRIVFKVSFKFTRLGFGWDFIKVFISCVCLHSIFDSLCSEKSIARCVTIKIGKLEYLLSQVFILRSRPQYFIVLSKGILGPWTLAYKMSFRVRFLSRKRIFMHASIWIAFFVIWSLLSTSRASILSLISLSKHIHTRYQAVLSK